MAKRVMFVIAPHNFRDEELLVPKDILEKRGFRVEVAAKTKSLAKGKLGAEVMPDLALSEVQAKNYDAIVYVGGPGARDYFDDPQALKLAQDFQKAGKVIAAICAGPSILANAGVLISKNVTAFPAEEENLTTRGAFYTGMQVEVDGKVVTGKDPSAAKEFGEKLAYLLEE